MPTLIYIYIYIYSYISIYIYIYICVCVCVYILQVRNLQARIRNEKHISKDALYNLHEQALDYRFITQIINNFPNSDSMISDCMMLICSCTIPRYFPYSSRSCPILIYQFNSCHMIPRSHLKISISLSFFSVKRNSNLHPSFHWLT